MRMRIRVTIRCSWPQGRALSKLPVGRIRWSVDARRELRAGQANPVLEKIEAYLAELAPRALPKSSLAKAVTYARNQWAALRRYTENGRLTIDNNVSERTLRHQAIGRKNYLFLGSETAGPRAAVLYTILAGAKRHRIPTRSSHIAWKNRVPKQSAPVLAERIAARARNSVCPGTSSHAPSSTSPPARRTTMDRADAYLAARVYGLLILEWRSRTPWTGLTCWTRDCGVCVGKGTYSGTCGRLFQ